MRILLWHVHGSWTTSFVAGEHEYILPLTAERGPDGRGRAQTWDWPASAREVPVDELAEEAIDVVILQRPEDIDLVQRWTGRRIGHDVPAIYLEHNAPAGHAVRSRHPAAEDERLRGVPVVHVTYFNRMAWDCGDARTEVIEHGIPDMGYRYTGEDPSLAVVVNEPVRRWRVAGTDLLLQLAREVPMNVYGMGMDQLAERARADGVTSLEGRLRELTQAELHDQLGRHRAYFHPYRWTSLGLSLLEAMTAGLPVLALSTTEAPEAIPPTAGLITCDLDLMRRTAHRWLHDPKEARDRGQAAREHALSRYGLARFLADWDRLLQEVAQ